MFFYTLAPRCPYWDACYRRNPEHFREMAHPSSGNAKYFFLKTSVLLTTFKFYHLLKKSRFLHNPKTAADSHTNPSSITASCKSTAK